MLEITYVAVTKDKRLPAMPVEGPYLAVVITDRKIKGSKAGLDFATWLVNTGCLCALVQGKHSFLVCAMIEAANEIKFDWNEVPEDELIHTGFYPDTPLEDLFEMIQERVEAGGDSHSLAKNRMVIVDVTKKAREEKILALV